MLSLGETTNLQGFFIRGKKSAGLRTREDVLSADSLHSFRLIVQRNPELKCLSLSGHIIDMERAEILVQILFDINNPNEDGPKYVGIESLDLFDNEISDEVALFLVTQILALGENRRLQEINLGENNLTSEGRLRIKELVSSKAPPRSSMSEPSSIGEVDTDAPQLKLKELIVRF